MKGAKTSVNMAHERSLRLFDVDFVRLFDYIFDRAAHHIEFNGELPVLTIAFTFTKDLTFCSLSAYEWL